MKNILIFVSLLTLVVSCNDHRQLQEEVDGETVESKQAPIQYEEPTQMERGYDGKEMGGGGGNR
jgi:hypothetical protein